MPARSRAERASGPGDRDVARLNHAGQQMAAIGHHAIGGLMAVDTAVMRRIADRGTDVGADFERRHAGGERHGGAARRSSGSARHVPGIVGGAVDGIEALPVGQHQRHIGLAIHDSTRLREARDGDRIGRCDVVLEARIAPGGGRARPVEALLRRHRHAIEGADGLSLFQAAVRGLRLLLRPLDVGDDNRIQNAIVPCMLVEAFLQQGGGRHLAGAKQAGEFGRGTEMQGKAGHGKLLICAQA